MDFPDQVSAFNGLAHNQTRVLNDLAHNQTRDFNGLTQNQTTHYYKKQILHERYILHSWVIYKFSAHQNKNPYKDKIHSQSTKTKLKWETRDL